jgi:hypothetical protein
MVDKTSLRKSNGLYPTYSTCLATSWLTDNTRRLFYCATVLSMFMLYFISECASACVFLVKVYLSSFCYCLLTSNNQEGTGRIPFTDLTTPQFGVCAKPELRDVFFVHVQWIEVRGGCLFC